MTTPAIAQPAQFGLRDELSGTSWQATFVKTGLLMGQAEAELAFDVTYEFKASTLLGEPILLCSARLTNPRGTVRFVRDRAVHDVQVTPDMAAMLNPHHLDLVVFYPISNAQTAMARCSTGIPGTEAREPLNLATSPSWGSFLCHTPMGGYWSVLVQRWARPDPDMLDRTWCDSYGGRMLGADEAKALFAGGELRADTVLFGSLSVNVSDLVRDAGRRMTAAAVADRIAEELYTAGPAAGDPILADRAAHERWLAARAEVIARIEAAQRETDPRARARAMQEAAQVLLQLRIGPDEPDGAAVRAYQADLARRLSSLDFQSFTAAERALTESLDATAREAAAGADAAMDEARLQIAAAPGFRFATDMPNSRFEETRECYTDRPPWDPQLWLLDEDDTCLAGPYDEASPFEGDVACVYIWRRDSPQTFFIDRAGSMLFDEYGCAPGMVRDGFAAVSKRRQGSWGIMALNGEIVVPLAYLAGHITASETEPATFVMRVSYRHEGRCESRYRYDTEVVYNTRGERISGPSEQRRHDREMCLYLRSE
ncbi:MAG: hypothetical protein JJU24_14075 [Natronohydrobacter sp.]|nr:hypothetical protein [Natronohydrobacter sp.]